MTEFPELAKALVKFQSIVPVIPKSKTANIPTKSGGSYKYTYADLSDMWDAIRCPLMECGLAVTQQLVGGSTGWTGIKTTLWHESGQNSAETVEVQTQGKTAQEVGSQITYFKRYALSATLGISTEEDDDGKAGNSPPPARLNNTMGLALVGKMCKEKGWVTNEQKGVVAAAFASNFHSPIVQGINEDLSAFVTLVESGAVTLDMPADESTGE